jgi:hypothetical protein
LKQEIIGIDIGGVIIDSINDNTDTSFFGDNYLKTTAVPDAFNVISQLFQKRFGSQIHLVSKCGKRTEDKTLEWLLHHRFYEQTGMLRSHVHFCRERHEKAGICEALGITHFVDDRLEVLGYLTSVPNRFLFQPQANEVQRYAQHLPNVTRVESWQEVARLLIV